MEFEPTNQEFRWISEGVPVASKAKRRKQLRHTSFCIGALKVNVGDFVLVRNDDALDPEDVLSCFVAQIKDLFYKEGEADPNQAEVQWFLRVSELPSHARKSIKTEECDWEVIQDRSNLWASWSSEVDAETIFQRCDILFLPIDADWETSLSHYDDHPFPVFFCRYTFSGKTVTAAVKVDELSSLSYSNSQDASPKKKKLSRASEKENGVSPSKKSKKCPKTREKYIAATVNGSLTPKVVIKKIDGRVCESLSNNNKIIVANSADALVDDIAETFKQKLGLKSPIIHSLSTPKSKSLSTPRENSLSTPKRTMPRKQRSSSKAQFSSVVLDFSPLNIDSDKKRDKTASPRKKSPSKAKKSPRKSILPAISTECPSPEKKAKLLKDVQIDCLATTRSGRKVKAVSYAEDWLNSKASASTTPSKKKGPRYVVDESEDSDVCHFSSAEESSSDDNLSDCSFNDEVSKPRSKSRKSSAGMKTPKRISKKLDLCIPERKTPLKAPQNILEETRQRLHVSAVPSSLPCRDEEYSDIYSFVKGCLCAQTGGCMYISGVPGTGKTATVHEVMRSLEEEKESGEVPMYKFVEVNGMWMTDPYQCYVHIYKALSGKTVPSQQAASLLEKRFTERGPKKEAVVLLVDELDRLWTRKQTVMYNIFDWPTKVNSKLIVLAIANTMDLPERMMLNRISSRVGLTRKTFHPYTFKQLQEIIMSRIKELNVFDPDAVQLVSRKVAAVSGDARRALDICRFATEVVNQKSSPRKKSKVLIGMEQIDSALQQMFSSPLISAIKSCSRLCKLFFQCLLSEFARSGLEETTLLKVQNQVVACCRFEGIQPPNSTEILNICADLATYHLILVDNFQNDLHMKIRLNVSSDDVAYALSSH